MFEKVRATFRLLTGPVPAGLMPVCTVGAAWSEVAARYRPKRGATPPSSLTVSVLTVAGFALASLLALWVFRRMLRRAKDAEGATLYGLSNRSWYALLWVGFVIGVVFGSALFIQTEL